MTSLPALRDSLYIIPLSSPFVNTFLKVFLVFLHFVTFIQAIPLSRPIRKCSLTGIWAVFRRISPQALNNGRETVSLRILCLLKIYYIFIKKRRRLFSHYRCSVLQHLTNGEVIRTTLFANSAFDAVRSRLRQT